MTKVLKRTFSLTEKQSAFIDAKVEAGDYASSSEVIREGLRALSERDAAIEHWLRTDVVAAYEAYKANPGSAKPLAAFFDDLESDMQTAADPS